MDKHQITDDYVAVTAQRRWGLTPRRTAQAEWHSPCPVCGGNDRFVIFSNGGFWCRQCSTQGWLDDDQKNFKPDPALMQKWKDELAAQVAEQARRDEEWRSGYAAGYARGWHDAMQESQRAWWHAQGMSNYLIDRYQLGFTPRKMIKTERGEVETFAYTIPIMDRDGEQIVNVQYRLPVEDVPELNGVGKYRQEYGISGREFYAQLGALDDGNAIIVEGVKKAIIVYDRLDAVVQVIGLPGSAPSDAIVERLRDYARIWIALDPDAQAKARRLCERIGRGRVVSLPAKPDDCFSRLQMTQSQFRNYLAQAR